MIQGIDPRSVYAGINIIASELIRPGYRYTGGDNIYINPTNYDTIKQLSAKGMLIAIGCLAELNKEHSS